MGGVLEAGASLIGASMGADAAESAANTQAQAAADATAEQRRQYDQTRQDQVPFLRTGTAANSQLAYLLGLNRQPNPGETSAYPDINQSLGQFGSLAKPFSMQDYQQDPGYAFRLAEGQKALERSAAAKGLTNSGAALKAAVGYGQDMGSQEFNNAYNRYNSNQTNLYNRLAGVSGTGQTSANTLGVLGQNTANQISSNILGAGAAQAAGQMGAANSWGTGLNNAFNALKMSRPTSYNSSVPYGATVIDTSNGLPWQI